MRVEKLIITNFRGIDGMELDFDPNVNVIFGANGAGKSTILDALAISLSWVVNRIQHSSSSGKPIVERDIKNDTSFASLETITDFASWKIVKNRKGHGSPGGKSDFSQLKQYIETIQNTLEHNDNKIGLPLFVYYPVNRAVVDIPLRIRKKHNFDVFSAYDEALDGGASFRTFFEWYREREDLENEKLLENRDSINRDYDFQLEAVRSAWETFLPNFRNFRVKRNPLRLEVEKNGEKVSVNQLSDGEKILITVIGDLARRLAIANPIRRNNPLYGEGVVLIDEIDLHLHPKWQRMIIEKLPLVFPNCQFIVTTHSPHVITHTKPQNLIRLTQKEMKIDWERPPESYGKNVDRILEDLMGLDTTRPDNVKETLSLIYSSIDTGNLEKAKVDISQLKELIGEDPDLVKAEVMIKRKEIIGK